jgi:hypothetical protein
MLPGFLEGAYKRYKNDTSIFMHWLRENGSKCGYKFGTVKDQAPAKTTRLKGKARKKAKEASNGESSRIFSGKSISSSTRNIQSDKS